MQLKIKDKQDFGDYFSLILEKSNGFNFYPGQYLDYELNKDTRAFTIAASPTENFLSLTTKKGSSEFKKALLKLKIEDNITTSHPAGTFILDESSPAVFIAGGIGITPFRSMIKYTLDQKLKTKIKLIYSNSDENFIFKDELETWQKQLNLNIIYHNSTKLGELVLDSSFVTSEAIYYLAGPPKMVASFEKILLDLGVDQTNIRYDNFDGY